jgi:hypothetical protein
MFGMERLSRLLGIGVSVDCQAGQMTIVIYCELAAFPIRGSCLANDQQTIVILRGATANFLDPQFLQAGGR